MTATPHPTAPGLQARCGNFGKAPVAVMLDTTLSDGAARLYSHMHAKYDRQGYLNDGRVELAEPLGVSPTTVTKRLGELIARNWIVAIEQIDRRGRTTNTYHVFEVQTECIKWKTEHADLPYAQISPPSEARKLRRSKGGKPCHRGRSTQVDLPDSGLTQVHQPSEPEFTNLVNLSSPPLCIEDSHTDKIPEEKINTIAAASAASKPFQSEPQIGQASEPDGQHGQPPLKESAEPPTGAVRRRNKDYPFKRVVSEELARIPFEVAEGDKNSIGWVSTISSNILNYEQRWRGLPPDVSPAQYEQLAADVGRFCAWYDAAHPGMDRPSRQIIKYWSEWNLQGRPAQPDTPKATGSPPRSPQPPMTHEEMIAKGIIPPPSPLSKPGGR